MTKAENIKAAIMRVEDKMRARPSIGHLSKTSKASIGDGLTCQVEDGPFTLMVDMKKSLGGNEAGPDPGVMGRAAISSCLAIGCAAWFARLDVAVNNVEVEVEVDFDYGGVLGTSEVSPSYSELRYTVHIDSPADESDIMRVLDKAEAHSPWLNNMKTPFQPQRTVRIAGLADNS